MLELEADLWGKSTLQLNKQSKVRHRQPAFLGGTASESGKLVPNGLLGLHHLMDREIGPMPSSSIYWYD